MLGWVGLALALVVGAAVRWTTLAEVEDLRPRPDALEYEEAARNLIAGDGYCLILDGGRYPPRYPPGFSLLLAPALWLTGGEYGSGVRVVFASALAGIATVWALGLVTGGPASAVAAALLLALAPLHVRWSQAVMSDVPTATATTVLALAGIVCLRRASSAGTWLALGAASGLAALLRATCAFVALPLGVALLVRREPRRLLSFACGVALGLLPAALYGLVRFGSPLAGGYEYWVAAEFFDRANLVDRPAGGGDGGNLGFYLRQLAGLGSLYPWPVALLAIAGCGVALRSGGAARLLAGITAGMMVALLAVYLPFFWQWDRFLLPLLPLVVALAAVTVGRAAPARLRVASAALVGVALATAWLSPGAFAPPDAPIDEVAALRAIGERVEPNAALVARGHVVLVSRLFRAGTDRLWLPIERCEHRALIHQRALQPYAPATPQNWVWDAIGTPFQAPVVEAAVGALLTAGRPVYFAPILADQTPLVTEVHRVLASRFALQPVPTSTPTGLVRVRTPTSPPLPTPLPPTGFDAAAHRPASVRPHPRFP